TTLNNMGVLLMKAEGKRKEALEAFTRTREIREKLVKDNPGVTRYGNSLAMTLTNIGILHREMKQSKEALAYLDLALKHLQAVRKAEPEFAPATNEFGELLGARATALTDLGRHAEAAADWGQFVLVTPARFRNFARIRRADSLARAGQGEQAMTEAEAVA